MICNLQLTFDTKDPDALMIFWGRALEYDNDMAQRTVAELREWRKEFPQYDGRGRMDDSALRRPQIYIEVVPEPKSQPNRLRLDVQIPLGQREAFLGQITALQGTADDALLRDCDGNEFTVSESDRTERRLRRIIIDSVDPERLADFWSEMLGWQRSGSRVTPPDHWLEGRNGHLLVSGHDVVEIPVGPVGFMAPPPDRVLYDLLPEIVFQRTDEPKTTKNRIHFDLYSTDHDADRDRALKLGAAQHAWHGHFIMRDPEGNEFCL